MGKDMREGGGLNVGQTSRQDDPFIQRLMPKKFIVLSVTTAQQ
jgi:hypothetical protein